MKGRHDLPRPKAIFPSFSVFTINSSSKRRRHPCNQREKNENFQAGKCCCFAVEVDQIIVQGARSQSTRITYEICRSNVSFVGAPPKRVCAYTSAMMQVAVTRNRRIRRTRAAGGWRSRTHGDLSCHQAVSEVVDQVLKVRHGLSQREATATQLLVHCLFISETQQPISPRINDMRQSTWCHLAGLFVRLLNVGSCSIGA